VIKRTFDLVVSGAIVALGFPLWLAIGAAIKLTAPGPVFYRDRRVGLHEREFTMLKFRTIVHDPAHTVPRWARKPTQVGQFLRYSRIERLPQLINVLRGEMSIIDPDGRSPSFLD
jgi:lipopolysaccharide/colanic/teichoic acid biosynthesis glycosyltransferase